MPLASFESARSSSVRSRLPKELQELLEDGSLAVGFERVHGQAAVLCIESGCVSSHALRSHFPTNIDGGWCWLAPARWWVRLWVDTRAKLEDLLAVGALRLDKQQDQPSRIADGFLSIKSVVEIVRRDARSVGGADVFEPPSSLRAMGDAFEVAARRRCEEIADLLAEREARKKEHEEEAARISEQIERKLDDFFAWKRATCYVGMDNMWTSEEHTLFMRKIADSGMLLEAKADRNWEYWSRRILKDMRTTNRSIVHDFRNPDEVFRHARAYGFVAL